MAEPAPEPQQPGPAPAASDILANKRVVDSVLPPIVFVTVYGATSLVPAAVAALLTAIALGVYRAKRREDVTGAIGGVFGTVIAAGIALISGRAEDYFVPRALTNTAFAVVLLGSIVVRKPLVGLAVQAFYGWPPEFVAQPRVRRIFTELTIPWLILAGGRAITYAILIDAGEVGLLAIVSFVLGWPLFALTLLFSFAYFRRRMGDLTLPPSRPAPG